jgi:hypothetical protein
MFYKAPSGNIYAIEKIDSVIKGSKTGNYPDAKDRIMIKMDNSIYVEDFENEEESDTVMRMIWEVIKNSNPQFSVN